MFGLQMLARVSQALPGEAQRLCEPVGLSICPEPVFSSLLANARAIWGSAGLPLSPSIAWLPGQWGDQGSNSQQRPRSKISQVCLLAQSLSRQEVVTYGVGRKNKGPSGGSILPLSLEH